MMAASRAGVPAGAVLLETKEFKPSEYPLGMVCWALRPGPGKVGEEQGRQALGAPKAEQHTCEGNMTLGKRVSKVCRLKWVFGVYLQAELCGKPKAFGHNPCKNLLI